MLTNSLLVFSVKVGVSLLNNFAHADLCEFLRHELLIEHAALDRIFVLYKCGDYFG